MNRHTHTHTDRTVVIKPGQPSLPSYSSSGSAWNGDKIVMVIMLGVPALLVVAGFTFAANGNEAGMKVCLALAGIWVCGLVLLWAFFTFIDWLQT